MNGLREEGKAWGERLEMCRTNDEVLAFMRDLQKLPLMIDNPRALEHCMLLAKKRQFQIMIESVTS